MSVEGAMSQDGFDRWCSSVNFLLSARFLIDLNDVGWTLEELRKFWDQGESAEDFVQWVAMKYDLDPITNLNLCSAAAPKIDH